MNELAEAKELTVTAREAAIEINKHDGASVEEFQEDYGIHATYSGNDVLGYLGY